jgi:acyl-CoA reductase-like NAD-dependent aldehyde dehydrogenase
MNTHISIPKTYKLFIGGKFVRSESGYSFEVTSQKGDFIANVAKASRKDARDAVVAARAAQPGWAGATAYNRGQVLYRVAEVMEGRRAQFVEEIRHGEGVSSAQAEKQVNEAIDVWVWFAGFADKYSQIAGNANAVSGPFFNLTTPEPTGVVAALAHQEAKGSSLVGVCSVVAPIVASGNTAVVLTHETQPLAALTMGEVLATSDVPAGVVNILSGSVPDVMPWLAGHRDVNALSLSGAKGYDWPEWEAAAADTLKRVVTPLQQWDTRSIEHITAFTEAKTVWHTKALG